MEEGRPYQYSPIDTQTVRLLKIVNVIDYLLSK